MSITVTGPTKTVTTTLTVTLEGSAAAESVGFRFWLPLDILPQALRAKARTAEPLKSITLSGGGDGWSVESEPSTDREHKTQLQVRLTLEKLPASQTATLHIPVEVSKTQNAQIQYQALIKRGRRWRPQRGGGGSFNVTVAPAGSDLAGKPAPQPKVKLSANVDDPTALPRGKVVTLAWTVENGVSATLMGPGLPHDEPLTLGGEGSAYPMKGGGSSIDVWVMTSQVYQLSATVDLGRPYGQVSVSRTVILDAVTSDDYGYVEITPSEVLPYGDVTANWAAWNVSWATLEMENVRGKGSWNPTVLGGAGGKDDDQQGTGQKPIPVATQAPRATLRLHYGGADHPLPSAEGTTAKLREWAKAKGALPVAESAVVAMCYAQQDGQAPQGKLVLCSNGAIWMADVGVNDESGSSVAFKRVVSLPAGAEQFLNVVPHGDGICALVQQNPLEHTLNFYDLAGKPVGSPINTPAEDVTIRLYTLADDKKTLRAYNAGHLAAPSAELVLDSTNAYSTTDANYGLFTAASVDGKHAAIAFGANKKAKIVHIDLTKNVVLKSCELSAEAGSGSGLRGLAISADGKRCALVKGGEYRQDIAVVNLETGQTEYTVLASKTSPQDVLFTQDGRYIVSSSTDNTDLYGWFVPPVVGNKGTVQVTSSSATFATGIPEYFGGNTIVNMVASRDGRLIIVGMDVGKIYFRIGTVDKNGTIAFSDGGTDSVGGLTFKDGWLVIAGLPNPGLRDVSITPDGKTLTVTLASLKNMETDGHVAVLLYRYDSATGQFGRIHANGAVYGATNGLLGTAMTPGGSTLIIGYQTYGSSTTDSAIIYDLHEQSAQNLPIGTDGKKLEPPTTPEQNIVMTQPLTLPAVALFSAGNRLLVTAGTKAYSYADSREFEPEPALQASTGKAWLAGKSCLFELDARSGKLESYQYGPAGLQRQTLADAVDSNGKSLLTGSVTPVVVDGLLLLVGPGGGDVPQDWVYNPQADAWRQCGHGLDMTAGGRVAYRRGESPRLWALGGKPVGAGDDGAALHTLVFDELGLFDEAYRYDDYQAAVKEQTLWSKLGSWTETQRGVMLANGWGSAADLAKMSQGDMNNTIIVELNKRTDKVNISIEELQKISGSQGMSKLIAWSALLAFLDHCGEPYSTADRKPDNLYNALFVANDNHLKISPQEQSGKSLAECIALGCRWSVDFVNHIRQIAETL